MTTTVGGGTPFYVSLDDSSGPVIGGRVAKTARVDRYAQPAIAAAAKSGRASGQGRAGQNKAGGVAVDGLGWARLDGPLGLLGFVTYLATHTL